MSQSRGRGWAACRLAGAGQGVGSCWNGLRIIISDLGGDKGNREAAFSEQVEAGKAWRKQSQRCC